MNRGSAATGIRAKQLALEKPQLVALAKPSRSRLKWLCRNQQKYEDRLPKPKAVNSVLRTLSVSAARPACEQTLLVPQLPECHSSLHNLGREKERPVERSRTLLPVIRISLLQSGETPNKNFSQHRFSLLPVPPDHADNR